MSERYLELATAGVRGLKAYTPGKPISEVAREYGVSDVIKLASNENPLGPPDAVHEVLRSGVADLALYPDPSGYALKRRLAERHDVDPACITLGNGSNEVLVMLAECFLSEGDEAVFSQYAFEVYSIAVQSTGARARIAPALPAGGPMALGHDADAIIGAFGERTRLAFIANPNNPTGTWLTASELQRILDAAHERMIVVVDQAYFEYVESDEYPDATGWLGRYPNLVVTRTFSKAYGLAGLRVGYAVSDPGLAQVLGRLRQPFNVNSLGQAAAVAALDDEAYLARSRQVNREGLEALAEVCSTLGLAHPPSAGNFLLVDTGRDAGEVAEQLLRRGIIVRPVAYYGLPRHLRISIGTPPQMARLAGALREIYAA